MSNYIPSGLCTIMCRFLYDNEKSRKYKNNLEEFRLSIKDIQTAAINADKENQYISTVGYKEDILFLPCHRGRHPGRAPGVGKRMQRLNAGITGFIHCHNA